MALAKRKTLEEPAADLARPQKSAREAAEPAYVDEPVSCLHDVCYPESYVPTRPSASRLAGEKPKPAKEFPFELDPFQSEAIKCLDNGESVMVSRRPLLSIPFPSGSKF